MNKLFGYAQKRLIDFGFREQMYFEDGKWVEKQLKTPTV